MGNTMMCVNDRNAAHPAKCVHWNEYINQTVPSGETLLTIAAMEGNLDLANRIICQGAQVNHLNLSGSSPLHVAIRMHHEEIVDLLLDSGADANIRDRSGLTPLHLACVTRSSNILQKLLRCGSNPDGIMDGKFYVSTPLMAAAENGDRNLAEILLRHNADANKRDWWQNTALLKAVQVGSVDLVRLLLTHHADPNVENRFGGTALQYSTIADHCEITSLLVKNGCSVKAKVHTDSGRGNSGKDAIVRHPPLAASIHRDCYKCFKFFLDRGVKVNGEDGKRKTPLIYAVTNRAWDCHNHHLRSMPQCNHSENPTSVDSTRLRFANELVDRGARMRPVWECVIWQMRSHYILPDDCEALALCIRAMGFVHREDFKVETFYRSMALSMQWEAVWLLYLAGFNLNDECLTIALNKLRMQRLVPNFSTNRPDANLTTTNPDLYPDVWMPHALNNPRALKNLCVIKIRECLPDNVIYFARKLNLPKTLYQMITLSTVQV